MWGFCFAYTRVGLIISGWIIIRAVKASENKQAKNEKVNVKETAPLLNGWQNVEQQKKM